LTLFWNRFRAEDEDLKLQNDWRRVAMVMDRLFLFLSSIVIIVVSVAILTRKPEHETDFISATCP